MLVIEVVDGCGGLGVVEVGVVVADGLPVVLGAGVGDGF